MSPTAIFIGLALVLLVTLTLIVREALRTPHPQHRGLDDSYNLPPDVAERLSAMVADGDVFGAAKVAEGAVDTDVGASTNGAQPFGPDAMHVATRETNMQITGQDFETLRALVRSGDDDGAATLLRERFAMSGAEATRVIAMVRMTALH